MTPPDSLTLLSAFLLNLAPRRDLDPNELRIAVVVACASYGAGESKMKFDAGRLGAGLGIRSDRLAGYLQALQRKAVIFTNEAEGTLEPNPGSTPPALGDAHQEALPLSAPRELDAALAEDSREAVLRGWAMVRAAAEDPAEAEVRRHGGATATPCPPPPRAKSAAVAVQPATASPPAVCPPPLARTRASFSSAFVQKEAEAIAALPAAAAAEREKAWKALAPELVQCRPDQVEQWRKLANANPKAVARLVAKLRAARGDRHIERGAAWMARIARDEGWM